MLTAKDVILQACSRVNLGGPGSPPPSDDIIQAGLEDLKGIVNKYNKDDLLSWTQCSAKLPMSRFIHLYDDTQIAGGKNNLFFDSVEDLESYSITYQDAQDDVWAMVRSDVTHYYTIVPDNDDWTWYQRSADDEYDSRLNQMKLFCGMRHVRIKNVAKIKTLYMKPLEGNQDTNFIKLEPASKADFNRYLETARVFTFSEKSQGEWVIEIKPVVARMNYNLEMEYNEGFDFDLNDDLYIPDNYTELLITATAHKLALRYPRLDDAQMARLENDVKVMVDNVRTPKADSQGIMRSSYWRGRGYGTLTQADLTGGRYL